MSILHGLRVNDDARIQAEVVAGSVLPAGASIIHGQAVKADGTLLVTGDIGNAQMINGRLTSPAGINIIANEAPAYMRNGEGITADGRLCTVDFAGVGGGILNGFLTDSNGALVMDGATLYEQNFIYSDIDQWLISPVTAVPNMPTGHISFWYQFKEAAAATTYLFVTAQSLTAGGVNNYIRRVTTSGGTIQMSLDNVDLSVMMSVNIVQTDLDKHHVIISWDGPNTLSNYMIDGVSQTLSVDDVKAPGMDAGNYLALMGRTYPGNNVQSVDGWMGDFVIAAGFIPTSDISKFRSSSGDPVDLGSPGSAYKPTGVQPIIYQGGDLIALDWRDGIHYGSSFALWNVEGSAFVNQNARLRLNPIIETLFEGDVADSNLTITAGTNGVDAVNNTQVPNIYGHALQVGAVSDGPDGVLTLAYGSNVALTNTDQPIRLNLMFPSAGGGTAVGYDIRFTHDGVGYTTWQYRLNTMAEIGGSEIVILPELADEIADLEFYTHPETIITESGGGWDRTAGIKEIQITPIAMGAYRVPAEPNDYKIAIINSIVQGGGVSPSLKIWNDDANHSIMRIEDPARSETFFEAIERLELRIISAWIADGIGSGQRISFAEMDEQFDSPYCEVILHDGPALNSHDSTAEAEQTLIDNKALLVAIDPNYALNLDHYVYPNNAWKNGNPSDRDNYARQALINQGFKSARGITGTWDTATVYPPSGTVGKEFLSVSGMSWGGTTYAFDETKMIDRAIKITAMHGFQSIGLVTHVFSTGASSGTNWNIVDAIDWLEAVAVEVDLGNIESITSDRYYKELLRIGVKSQQTLRVLTEPDTYDGNTYVYVGGVVTELNVLVGGVKTGLTTIN